MNQKQLKKMRQFQRKMQDRFWGEALKPKPKWLPWKLWLWGLGLFVKIEDNERKD